MSDTSAIVWCKKPPTKEGWYFRRNPPCSHTVRAYVYEINNVLFISACDGRIDVSKRPTWWWYGPIPECPLDEDEK